MVMSAFARNHNSLGSDFDSSVSQRHTLGFGIPAPLPQKKALLFFRLLPRFGSLRAAYNRWVHVIL